MKKIFLILFTFISLAVTAQIKVKEGSFHEIEGFVMTDKQDHLDMNNAPMALIKISTLNINAEQRKKFTFKGNAITYFDVYFMPGEIFLYVSADAATFIEIIHDDYGKIEYWLPFDLMGFRGYEMILEYIPSGNIDPHNNYVTITTKPDSADVYIDEKFLGQTPKVIHDLQEGKHELKLIKKGCQTFVKMIDIRLNETLVIDETLQHVKEVRIITEQKNDNVYINGNYIGKSPITTELTYGTYEIKAERNGRVCFKTIEVSQYFNDNVVKLMFGDNQTFVVNGVSFEMIFVKGGDFMMGSNDRDADEKERPTHKVRLSDYYIGETEVTQELWKAVMGNNPSVNKGDKNPVENVSWNDCQKFVKKLTYLTGVDFRLPTEAEWEYAARGGDRSNNFKYSGSNKIKDVAYYYDNSKNETSVVRTKLPNELGIYDMSGNVWEWCYDIYDAYKNEMQINPTGASVGSYRVIRGGCFYDGVIHCKVYNRDYSDHNTKNAYRGFRIAVSL